MSEFADLLRLYREKTGLSQSTLGRLVEVDGSYISRLEASDRSVPRRELVDALAKALKLDFDARNKLLISAGYQPSGLDESIKLHPAMRLLADILDNEGVPSDEKDLITQQLRQIRRRYGQDEYAGE